MFAKAERLLLRRSRVGVLQLAITAVRSFGKMAVAQTVPVSRMPALTTRLLAAFIPAAIQPKLLSTSFRTGYAHSVKPVHTQGSASPSWRR